MASIAEEFSFGFKDFIQRLMHTSIESCTLAREHKVALDTSVQHNKQYHMKDQGSTAQ